MFRLLLARGRTFGLFSALLLMPLALVAQESTALRTFSYPSDADSLVLELVNQIHMLAEQDDAPSLRLYGDGRLVAHYPAIMKRAGDWQRVLSRTEMDQALSDLLAAGALETESQTLRAEVLAMARQHAAQQRVALESGSGTSATPAVFISDDETTTLRVRLDSYRSPEATRTLGAVDHRLELLNHKTLSDHYPQLERLVSLSDALLALENLAEHEDMTRIDGAGDGAGERDGARELER